MATTGSLRQRLAVLLTKAADARSGCPVSTKGSSIPQAKTSGSGAAVSSPATWGSSGARSGAAGYPEGKLGLGSGAAGYSQGKLGVGSGAAVYFQGKLVGSGVAVYLKAKLPVGSRYMALYNMSKRGLSGAPNPAETSTEANEVADGKECILKPRRPCLKSFEKLYHSLKKWWAVFEGCVKVCLIVSSTVGGVAVFYSLNMSPGEAFGLLQYLHDVKSSELKALVQAYGTHTSNANAALEADTNSELQAALTACKIAWHNAMDAAKQAGRLEALADVEKKVQAAKEEGRLQAMAEFEKRAAESTTKST